MHPSRPTELTRWTPPRAPRRARPAPSYALEPLEPRRVLSVTIETDFTQITVYDGVLELHTRHAADADSPERVTFKFYDAGGPWGPTLNITWLLPDGSSASHYFPRFEIPDLRLIRFDARGGDDFVAVDPSPDALPFPFDLSLTGGAGDDTPIGGPGHDRLAGGDGNDTINGQPDDRPATPIAAAAIPAALPLSQSVDPLATPSIFSTSPDDPLDPVTNDPLWATAT